MYSLAYQDFWPACLLAEECFRNAQFERFDILVPKANAWLRQNPRAEVTKCQTLEKRITSPEQLSQNNPRCDPSTEHSSVYFVKGLRIWYYIISPSHTTRHHPMQVAYRNFLPRVLEATPGDWPEFEDLTELYATINEDLDNRPVEGCILTVETLALHVESHQLIDLAMLQVEQTQWLDMPGTSLLYITRVFYCFQCPAYEQVGAADFFPDHQTAAPDASLAFSSFSTVVAKVNCWLTKVKDIRITNIQTLETMYEPTDQEDKLETSTNFLPPEPDCPLVRFVRVTYVRPKYGLPPGGLKSPRAIWFRNFVPLTLISADRKSGRKSEGQGQAVSAVWERVQQWQQHENKTVLDVEVLYYPLSVLQKEQEDIETTVLGDVSNVVLVQVLRVYYSCTDTKPISNKHGKPHQAQPKPSCVLA